MLRATFETNMRMLGRASLGHMHKLSHGPAEVREEKFNEPKTSIIGIISNVGRNSTITH